MLGKDSATNIKFLCNLQTNVVFGYTLENKGSFRLVENEKMG
jgi:hypothetical protein